MHQNSTLTPNEQKSYDNIKSFIEEAGELLGEDWKKENNKIIDDYYNMTLPIIKSLSDALSDMKVARGDMNEQEE